MFSAYFCLRRTPRVNPFDHAQHRLPSSSQKHAVKHSPKEFVCRGNVQFLQRKCLRSPISFPPTPFSASWLPPSLKLRCASRMTWCPTSFFAKKLDVALKQCEEWYNLLMNMIQQNIVRTYIYMAILTSVVALMAYAISQASGYGSSGVGIGLIIAGVMNFVAYYFSDRIVLAQTRAKKVSPQDSPEYFEIVSSLARRANLPMPAIYIIPDTAMNAFATGRDAEHAAVAVTQGLLQKLNRDEIEGVIAHELSHVRNYDMRLMSTVSILVGMLNILANMFWQSGLMGRSSSREDSRVNSIISIILIMVTPIVGMLIQLAISRQREYLADASAAKLVGSPQGLISALHKLDSSKMPLATADVSTAHLYISNPFGDNNLFTNIFSTHPPMQERIARLEQLSV